VLHSAVDVVDINGAAIGIAVGPVMTTSAGVCALLTERTLTILDLKHADLAA
jgi:hypothetical protein